MPVGRVEGVQSVNQREAGASGGAFAGPPQAELGVRVDEVELLPRHDAVDGRLPRQPEPELDIRVERQGGKAVDAWSRSTWPGW